MQTWDGGEGEELSKYAIPWGPAGSETSHARSVDARGDALVVVLVTMWEDGDE